MPQVFESEIVYNYPPAHAINWLHRKYPNPYADHVQSIDTVSREVDPVTGIIRSERIVGIQQAAPKWVTRALHLPPTTYAREIVFINPPVGDQAASATMMSVNLSLAQHLSCLEIITYTPFPTDSSSATRTLFHQKATMLSGFPNAMIARRIEKASLDRFSSNAGLGKKGFEWVLEQNRPTITS